MTQEFEEWRSIPSMPNYEASNFGNLRKNGNIVKLTYKRRYYVITVSINGKKKQSLVHRLVAEAFGLNTDNFIDHIDGNPSNNSLANLRPATHTENIAYAYGRNPEDSGVYYRHGKFQAKCWVKKKSYVLGVFEKIEDARNAVKNFRLNIKDKICLAN